MPPVSVSFDGVPCGAIVLWPDGLPLPHGWCQCDGTRGTPDLRGRRIPGLLFITRPVPGAA